MKIAILTILAALATAPYTKAETLGMNLDILKHDLNAIIKLIESTESDTKTKEPVSGFLVFGNQDGKEGFRLNLDFYSSQERENEILFLDKGVLTVDETTKYEWQPDHIFFQPHIQSFSTFTPEKEIVDVPAEDTHIIVPFNTKKIDWNSSHVVSYMSKGQLIQEIMKLVQGSGRDNRYVVFPSNGRGTKEQHVQVTIGAPIQTFSREKLEWETRWEISLHGNFRGLITKKYNYRKRSYDVIDEFVDLDNLVYEMHSRTFRVKNEVNVSQDVDFKYLTPHV